MAEETTPGNENMPSAKPASSGKPEAKGFSLVAVLILILVTAAVFGLIGYWSGTIQSVSDEGQTANSNTPPVPAVPSTTTSETTSPTSTATSTGSAATTISQTPTATATTSASATASSTASGVTVSN